MSGEGARYRFGPRERGGALAGWRAGQILTVAAGLVDRCAHACVREPNPAGVGMGSSCWWRAVPWRPGPSVGERATSGFPSWCGGASRRAGRGGRRSDGLPGRDFACSVSADIAIWVSCTTSGAGRSPPPSRLRGQGFALLGPDEQDRRVAGVVVSPGHAGPRGFTDSARAVVGGLVSRSGFGVRDYLATQQRADPASACVASYEALLSDIDADACTHDVVLTVQVRLSKSVETGSRPPAARDGVVDPAAWPTPTLSSRACWARTILSPASCAPMSPSPTTEGDVAVCRWIRGPWPWRRSGPACVSTACCTPRSGWRSGPASKCGATSLRHCSSARHAPRCR